MKIAVLFDGGGLARLGLEQAGHECTGIELDPWKHCLSKHVGSGNSILADARDVDLSGFDAVWASPPCQRHSNARHHGKRAGKRDHVGTGMYDDPTLLPWCETIETPVLWIENVYSPYTRERNWRMYNAAQFLEKPIQNRRRAFGGRFREPAVYRQNKQFPGICPVVMATEFIGHANDRSRASRWYGRKLTVDECAYHQGFEIPDAWREPPRNWPLSEVRWLRNLYMAIGNGVPVYMAKAFGQAYTAEHIPNIEDLLDAQAQAQKA